MRIVQLSDIHLSNGNLADLKNFYLDALIEDLKLFHDESPIDFIVFTGDLVDKGGSSLGSEAYTVFENEVILPLMKALSIEKKNFLMIPGNHDIQRHLIEPESEFFLSKQLTKDMANIKLNDMRDDFINYNNRVKAFKLFEQGFHHDTENYMYSNNESLYIIDESGMKVGIALINDSWRCSADLKSEQHYFGYNQLFNAKRYFKEKKTALNIVLLHHPLDAINQSEREEVENILKSQDFDVVFFGHSHRYRADKVVTDVGGYLALNGRAAFNNSQETSSLFQPGYTILDINLTDRSYVTFARKFIRKNGFRFDKDTDSLIDGQSVGDIPIKNNYFKLATSSNNEDNKLPDSYTADVHRIVSLLIGKSLYPDPYIFMRELVQNAVDACNRARKKQTLLNPTIKINIDTAENFVEITDEGDGMSKDIINNHFSVIGKSISQEFNDSTGNFNLISQFGIGFISTFIVAEKVIINTKNDADEQVMFEVSDVFKGFKYINLPENLRRSQSGTSIRVYMKREYFSQIAFQKVITYCRHILNLECYLNGSRIGMQESWNIEDSISIHSDSNERYEVKLGISMHSKPIIASNSGFLIATNPPAIIPYKFPYLISGEVNFKPKGIDFDMSRSNILATEKSYSFRREISIVLRKFFRSALESSDPKIGPLVLNHFQHYLQYYDTDRQKMEETYSDFYSKKELIELCTTNMSFPYKGLKIALKDIITEIKRLGLNVIYYNSKLNPNDYDAIVIKHLESKGNFIFFNRSFNVPFRDVSQITNLQAVMQIIADEYGFVIEDVNSIDSEKLKEMKMDKSQFPEKLLQHLYQIEEHYQINIEIGKFSKATKPSASNGSQIFLNFDHTTFQSMLQKIEDVPDEGLRIYLLGLLGLQLKDL